MSHDASWLSSFLSNWYSPNKTISAGTLFPAFFYKKEAVSMGKSLMDSLFFIKFQHKLLLATKNEQHARQVSILPDTHNIAP
jgi:hypothetical protein